MDKIQSRLNELLAITETRELTREERAEVDGLKNAVTDHEGRIGALEAESNAEADAAPAKRMVLPWIHTRKQPESRSRTGEILRSWFKLGTELETDGDIRTVSQGGHSSSVLEVRSGLVSNAVSGSYAVPQTVLSQFATLLVSYCDWLGFSRVIRTTSGETLKLPVDATARQTGGAEIAAFINEAVSDSDKSVVLEQRELHAYTATSGIQRLSLEIISDAAIDIEQLVVRALATRIGRLLSKAFAVGTGVNEPTGLLHASSNITVVPTAGAAAVALDDLIETYSMLDPAYQSDPSTRWVMHPAIWGLLLKLKDSTNRPYFAAPQNGGDVVGAPAGYILGKPVVLNPHFPTAIESGKGFIAVGAFSEFAIRQAGNLQLRRTNDLYWASREVGFNSIVRVDSKVLDPNAFRILGGK